ncbi:carbohydrate porin [Acetobacter thailandicus]|uniref:carbohydrate porin n=1 Tax=Acetobacter thailandicus TaxID=1502842 RepID=UPI001BA55A69|nr:carbohydrate porin [Acetobacter thailandicus]MBS0984880.1 carbohydrate porin [Acetobacter thailandicus]
MQRIIKILCTCSVISGAAGVLPAMASTNPPVTHTHSANSHLHRHMLVAGNTHSTTHTIADAGHVNLTPADQLPAVDASGQPVNVIGRHTHTNNGNDFLAAPNNLSPKILPSVPVSTMAGTPAKKGFFYNVLKPLKDYGITFHALLIDNFVSNVQGGVKQGSRLQNALGVVETNIDLNKLIGWKGAQIHFGEDFFFLRDNDKHWSQQVGDNTLGYQPPHLFRGNYLSELTLDQKLFSDKLEIEAGRANISRYFLIPNCNQILTCFKDVWSQDAGISTFVFATWSGHAIYHITKSWYFQAAATEVNKTIYYQNGWNWNTDTATGATGVGEIGYKRGFDETAYPSMYEFLGYYNSSATTTTARATTSSGGSWKATQHTGGMSGIFFTGQQYIWRADHGTTRDPHNMAVAIYGGAGTDFQSYAPVKAEAYLGAFVQAPFKSHPLDTYGVQLHWTKLGSRETQFLAEANKASGGDGKAPSAAHLVADIHAHVFLFPNVAIEPSLQYAINPNTYYAPMTAKHPRDALEVGATLFVYLDKMAGFP